MKTSIPGAYADKRRGDPKVSFRDPDYAILSELVPVLEGLAAAAPAKVLDFGAGNAPYKSLFHNSRYVAADVEQNRAGDIDIIVHRMPLPLANDSVDLVLCIYVLEHVRDYLEILREFHRVLRPGGRLLVVTPFIYREHEAPIDFHRPTKFCLTADLRMFDHVELRKVGNSEFTLYALANELHIKEGERTSGSRAAHWLRGGFNRLLLPLLNRTLFARPASADDSVYHSLFALSTKGSTSKPDPQY